MKSGGKSEFHLNYTLKLNKTKKKKKRQKNPKKTITDMLYETFFFLNNLFLHVFYYPCSPKGRVMYLSLRVCLFVRITGKPYIRSRSYLYTKRGFSVAVSSKMIQVTSPEFFPTNILYLLPRSSIPYCSSFPLISLQVS